MSVQGERRPPQGGLVRKPRGDRAADQLELNGGLVRTDNSDTLYKAILMDLLAKDTGRELTWALALEALDERPFAERREVLVEATLAWCAAILGLVLRPTQGFAGTSTEARRAALAAVAERCRVVEGKQRARTQHGGRRPRG